jgi:hypothetical protein
MCIPDTKVYEFPGPDESWRNEMLEFEKDIKLKRRPDAGLREARVALAVVEKIMEGRNCPSHEVA